jgi:phage terminase large subunit
MQERAIRIKTADVFLPLLEPFRYKGAWGGRASGKSRFFGGCMIEDHLRYPGLASVCIREVQKDLSKSAKRLIERTLQAYGLSEKDGFKVFKSVIEAPGDGIIIFNGMQEHTKESIKSLEDFDRMWAEEAQTLSNGSLSMLTPTFRSPGNEMWFSWNPRLRRDPVDMIFRGEIKPRNSVGVETHWSKIKKFLDSSVEEERLNCMDMKPEEYPHIWDGDYVSISSSAYYSKDILAARHENRIGVVAHDPLITYGAFIDLGGTGARADNFVIWIAQFVGAQIRVLNHYEVSGQPMAAHLNWMLENGYNKHNTTVWLPHDGETNDRVFDISYKSAFKSSGFEVEIIPNQGKGAASTRIEAVRRIFPNVWINESTCNDGLLALSWYHEKIDEKRQMGLGPDHDWSSHSADSFGIIPFAYERTRSKSKKILDPYRGFREDYNFG